MVRKIIKIDELRCNGCGACVSVCREGAIRMAGGKAKLLRDDYCDGLGNCLPVCPCGAITFEEREAPAFNREAVKANAQKHGGTAPPVMHGCPGMRSKTITRDDKANATPKQPASVQSNLRQWPIQIKLVPPAAPYFNNANLLVAADCCAYTCGSFHADYMKNAITIIGCPKLDDVDYSDKLTGILKNNHIKSVKITRMEVPCCGGLEHAVQNALQNCGKMIPWQIVTLGTDGGVAEG
ncbi:MAG: 4Fe-4S binding protein [Chitinispirillia bacterium]|nr:4Fe-4S binding protein [Chitinispirillia bacterium]MCL2269660.1 4Fe-4S binding protein [Chitinispirillia bacterium]